MALCLRVWVNQSAGSTLDDRPPKDAASKDQMANCLGADRTATQAIIVVPPTCAAIRKPDRPCMDIFVRFLSKRPVPDLAVHAAQAFETGAALAAAIGREGTPKSAAIFVVIKAFLSN